MGLCQNSCRMARMVLWHVGSDCRDPLVMDLNSGLQIQCCVWWCAHSNFHLAPSSCGPDSHQNSCESDGFSYELETPFPIRVHSFGDVSGHGRLWGGAVYIVSPLAIFWHSHLLIMECLDNRDNKSKSFWMRLRLGILLGMYVEHQSNLIQFDIYLVMHRG